ncbi:ribosome-binding protein 1a isoform X2 [Centropristis striata]|uniref:ribosome-binding protein 1a isoform X2 n=1 Tax=Centropristis striata TaxID=184440 RepID=UPI0027E04A13|nr:ribosome-binding protein 1a isoform X2 [Centropristis striata]
MDIYDPQTLGIMVFGGFMVISALGIALVSTFSMKETSYEEALAKQRRELGKIHSTRSEKKKKDKVSEKKSKGKKKEEKPNGKIPEPEKNQEEVEAEAIIELAVAPVVAAAAPPVPTPEPVSAVQVKTNAAAAPEDTQPKMAAEPSPALTEPSPAPSPKDKKKKKVAKVEPAQTAPLVAAPAPVKSSAVPASTQPPVSAQTKAITPSSAPATAKSTPAPATAKSATAKSAPATAKSAPAPAKSAPAPAPATAKSAPAPAKSAPSKSAPATAKSASATAKSAPAPAKGAAAPAKSSPAPSKNLPVLEAVTKDVPVMAVPPVGSQQAPSVAGKVQEPKKKASKKKTEPVAALDSADAPLYLPYKALVSTISSMVFSEGEAHRIIEILSEKVGIIQDTWHMATQKGDPIAMLKKQLDEREKQLAAEQEDASLAKNRLRELTKELSAEKSKVASVETRLSSLLSKREQEMIALQARMQASYQDHVAQTQGLNAKIVSLQDQLEKGPNAQLARLQQENSILRDALNQATSQAESKQNAELAKLRQECTKLTKELGEKTESLLADEHIRKGLEAKVLATEKQLSLFQANHGESEQALQTRLEEVCEELRAAQSRNNSLQATLDKAQQETSTLSEFQVRTERLEAEISKRSGEADALTAQLEETQAEKSQLEQQVATINSLLEASQTKNEEGSTAEVEQLKYSLQERENQLNTLHEELKQLQMKQEAADNTIIELEQGNKREDLSLITSLQDELANLKEEMANHGESEQAFQRKFEEVCEELRATQDRNNSLQATLDKSQQETSTLSEFQVRTERLEAEISKRSGEADALTAQLEETQAEKSQLEQQVATINSLLEASQTKNEEVNQVNTAEVEQLKYSLQERENQLNTLHEELKQLQMKQEAAENIFVELEQKNKSGDVSFITSLQNELANLKEELVERTTDLEVLQNSVTKKDGLIISLQEEQREVRENATNYAQNITAQMTAFQTETKEILQTLFPQMPVDTEQSDWLQVFTQKAQEALSQQRREAQLCTELLEKMKEAEESHGALQAECEQYRTVLAETEGMLKHLQNSVEEEELVWKSKMAELEDQLRMALERAGKLEEQNQSVEQLKGHMMLLEAQLEKQSENQGMSEELEQVKLQLVDCQSQLDLAQKEAQAHKEELAQVREQLCEIMVRAQQEQNGPADAQPSQFQNELSQTTEKLHGEVAQRQLLSQEFEQAQETIRELQAQLDLLKVSSESPQVETEDVGQLKERLEKEKKLSKDLGQAATKLQQLLKATQEQLTKERDTVRTLQEHLEGKGEYVELKEGTSV